MKETFWQKIEVITNFEMIEDIPAAIIGVISELPIIAKVGDIKRASEVRSFTYGTLTFIIRVKNV